MEHRANLFNAMQIATQRGFKVVEEREPARSHMDSIRMELESDDGLFSVVGAVVLDKPRLLQVESISCEATLGGHLMYSKSDDVPGVIGYLGSVLGRNGINIANFALGREDVAGDAKLKPASPLTAISIVETDEPVTEGVISQLFENPAFRFVRRVEFGR